MLHAAGQLEDATIAPRQSMTTRCGHDARTEKRLGIQLVVGPREADLSLT